MLFVAGADEPTAARRAPHTQPSGRSDAHHAMTNPEQDRDEEGFEPIELEIDDDGPVDWAKALAELEASPDEAPARPPAPPKEDSAAEEPPEAPDAEAEARLAALRAEREQARAAQRAKLEALRSKPAVSMKKDDMTVVDELAEILSKVNTALNELKRFERKHPQLVAPNILRAWEYNLKETSTMMLREFDQLREGQKQKTYDARFVCKECKTVFMEKLPGDRLCDECRARLVPRGGGEG